jgi:uncharacterized glyoxalase superfamily protein PhnB
MMTPSAACSRRRLRSAGTTQSPYFVVRDADQVYRQAKAAGAEIVIEIKDEDYGGRVFSCRDPEGHLWNVGSYDPWKAPG